MKKAWFLLGVLVLLASCELPWNPDEVEVTSFNFSTATDAGIIDAQKGLKFLFYSTVSGAGTAWWGKFQVPVTGAYTIYHGGQPAFEMSIRTSQSSGLVASPANDQTVTATLTAGTDYYVKAYQPGGAIMGATTVWVWAD
jgi:hypothetical protein